MNERICTSGQIERDQSFFGWLWVLRNLIEIQCTFSGWLAKHEYQNSHNVSIFCNKNCICLVQLVGISLCRLKKKFCGCMFVFCSKEFLRWGERVWTNRQADLRNDKHVLLCSLTHIGPSLPVTIVYSKPQTKQFLQLQFWNKNVFISSPSLNFFFLVRCKITMKLGILGVVFCILVWDC